MATKVIFVSAGAVLKVVQLERLPEQRIPRKTDSLLLEGSLYEVILAVHAVDYPNSYAELMHLAELLTEGKEGGPDTQAFVQSIIKESSELKPGDGKVAVAAESGLLSTGVDKDHYVLVRLQHAYTLPSKLKEGRPSGRKRRAR